MKTFKKILFAFAFFAMVIPVFNSCKKGTEDPFLSLRSRDKRVEGTWTLKSVDYSYSSTTTSSTNNNVNSDTKNSTDVTLYSVAYDGTNMSTNKKSTSNSTDNYKTLTGFYPNQVFSSKSDVDSKDKTEIWTKSYSIVISLYNDNTYSYTTINKGISYSRTTVEKDDGLAVTPSPRDTSVAGTYDGNNYYSTDEETQTQHGTWSWADDDKSGKDKIIINAGPLTGYIARLSNKELIIDHTFGTWNNFYIDGTYSSQMTEDNNTNQIENTEKDLDTYSNVNNPYLTTKGKETTTTNTIIKVTSGKSTWEKTDKGRKREDGASAE